MSAIIEASDIACASAACDLFGGNGFSTNQQIALVAQLFADHRAKAEANLRIVRADRDEAKDLIAEIQRNCHHTWEKIDASFDHAYGTEIIRYMQCEHCGKRAEWDDVDHPEDDDEPRIDQRELREIDP